MTANGVIVASTAADAEAVETIKNHHAELAARIAALTDAMLSAAEHGGDFESTRGTLSAFLTGELLPHARAEEERLYPAAAHTDRARPLVESMIAAHRIIGALVDRIASEASPVRAAATGHALRVLFDAHLTDENERILPIVAADPDVSLAEVTHGMHELLGGHRAEGEQHEHSCGCGETGSVAPRPGACG